MPILSKDTQRKLQDFGEGIVSPLRSHQAASEVRSAIDAERRREDRAEAAAAQAEAEKRDSVRGQKAYKKGGSVKGWGIANRARKAKMV